MREVYHMIDIETTGTDKDNDDILEIAVTSLKRIPWSCSIYQKVNSMTLFMIVTLRSI